VSADEITRAAEALAHMAVSLTRSMSEQAGAASEISKAADSMRQQSEQAARALHEQGRAMKDMTSAAASTAKQIKAITTANKNHSRTAAAVVDDVTALRDALDRSVDGVRQTQTSSAELLQHVETITSLVSSANGSNGHHHGTNDR
jgi:methyl-accepting chemotaxis protein